MPLNESLINEHDLSYKLNKKRIKNVIIHPSLNLIGFVIFVIFGVVVVAGESTLLFSSQDTNWSLLSIVWKNCLCESRSYIKMIFSIIPIFLLFIITSHGIFSLKISYFYAFFPNKLTDPSSLIYSAMSNNQGLFQDYLFLCAIIF